MSSSAVIRSDSTTLHDAIQALPRSSEEEKSTRTAADRETEGDDFIDIVDSDADLEYPDGGWRAWGVVFGVSRFPLVDPMRV